MYIACIFPPCLPSKSLHITVICTCNWIVSFDYGRLLCEESFYFRHFLFSLHNHFPFLLVCQLQVQCRHHRQYQHHQVYPLPQGNYKEPITVWMYPNLTNFMSFCVIRVNDVQVRCCHHREYEHHLSVPTSQK